MKNSINTHLSFALQVGSRILDKYRILKILNNTQFGFDYLVESIDDESDKRIYIIKEFFPKDCVIRGAKNKMLLKAALNTEELLNFNFLRKLFHGEAKNLAKISNTVQTNIVQLIEVLENKNNTTYMIILYEEGISLQEYLEKRKKRGQRALSNEEIYQIINPLLDALESIYKLGIHHLGIKPENILIRKNGTPLLIGFHSSTIYFDEYSKNYRNLTTPEYASPEQIAVENISEVDTRSDIYSMGVLLYYLMTDRLPPKAEEREKSRKDDPYVSLLKQELLFEYDSSLLIAVDKALSVSKKYRFKDPNHFKNAILTKKSTGNLSVKKERKFIWYIVGLIVSIIVLFIYFSSQKPSEVLESKSSSMHNKTVKSAKNLDIEAPIQKVVTKQDTSKNSVSKKEQEESPVERIINETNIQIDVKLPLPVGETIIHVNGKEYSDGNMRIQKGESYEISIENPYYQPLNIKRSFDELLAFPMQSFILILGKSKMYLDGLLPDTQIKVYKVEANQRKEFNPEIIYKNGMYEMILPSGIKFYMVFDKVMYKSQKTDIMNLEHGKALTLTYNLEKKDIVTIPKEIFVPVSEKNITLEKNTSSHEVHVETKTGEKKKEVKSENNTRTMPKEVSIPIIDKNIISEKNDSTQRIIDRVIEAEKTDETTKEFNSTSTQENIAKKSISKDKKSVKKNVPKKKKPRKVQKKNEPATSNTSGHVWYCNAKAIGTQKVSAKHADKSVAEQLALKECNRRGSGCKILNCFLLRN